MPNQYDPRYNKNSEVADTKAYSYYTKEGFNLI